MGQLMMTSQHLNGQISISLYLTLDSPMSLISIGLHLHLIIDHRMVRFKINK